jgi:U3 small nucleolar RNA-associated protein 6
VDKLRVFRKKTQGEDAVHGMADTAGVRRLHFIYARALRKFKGDLRLWHSYLAFCKSNGAAKRLDRALTQALQLHSGVPALWVYAAGWEVSSSPPSGDAVGDAEAPPSFPLPQNMRE